MEKITYGVPRLVDWVALIKVGAATIKVHFTGGAMTKYGVTPAEYTTDNEFIQNVIEQSNYFKQGRIIKLRSIHIAGTDKAKKEFKMADGSKLEEVQVTCLQDAQNYLKENYGIPAYKVRKIETAKVLGMERGVKFVGDDFE